MNTMRTRSALFAVALAAVLALTGCGEKTVKVQTGERVVCTYGETISTTVKTIEVPASKAADYRVVTKKVTCARHKALEALYAAAQKSIADGDLAAARAKLAEVLAMEAGFRKAAEQAAQIDAGKTPKPDTGGGPATPGGSTETTGSGVPETPVASLAKWVPDSIPGYKADPVVADTNALTREYVPSGSAPVVSIVVVAEQFKTADAAKAAADDTIARQYPSSRSTVDADGRKLSFGVSGTKFAAVAWNEGAILVVVEGYPKSGSGSSLKGTLQTIASAIIP